MKRWLGLGLGISLVAALTSCASRSSVIEMNVTEEFQPRRAPLIEVCGGNGPCTVTSTDNSIKQEGDWVGQEVHYIWDGCVSFYFPEGEWIDINVKCNPKEGHKYVGELEPYTKYIFRFPVGD